MAKKSMLQCVATSKGELTVGDIVKLEHNNDTYVINKFLERKNLISRPNPYQRKNKNIAANIDQAAIIITHAPAPVEHYIDRYLAALHNSNIQPIIIINKVDSQTKQDKADMDYLADIYKAIGYEVFYISAINNIGIDKLLESLKGKTSIFLGQSGVGKSETLNTIIGDQITSTKNISESTKKVVIQLQLLLFMRLMILLQLLIHQVYENSDYGI